MKNSKENSVETILKKLNINETGPISAEQWKLVLDEVRTFINQLAAERDHANAALKVGFDEIQKVWGVINEREDLIRSVLDSSEDIIITLNEKSEVIEYNHVAEKFFDKHKLEVRGRDIFNVIKGGSVFDDLSKILKDDIHGDHSNYYGSVHERTLANYAGEEVSVSVLFNKIVTGNTIVYPLYMHDLSTIKKAELEIENSRAQVAFSSKLSSLGEMAGGIAHEINTPLAIIQMRSDQLLEQAREDAIDRTFAIKALESIDSTVHRIAKIVKSLRSFSRDGSKDPIVITSVQSIVDDTFSLCREKFNSRGIILNYKSHVIDPFINCRSSEISQVLLNLLNNSYDAIETQEEKWISIEARAAEGRLFIEVLDSGPGISKEIQSKIMNPFFTTKEIGKGTGLGLSISKGIIESHGGRITIDNNSKNTKFVIDLPLAVSQQIAI